MVQTHSVKVQKMLMLARRDEQASRATWPAALEQAAIMELCGGALAVYELAKADV